jgi:hypothetical protein
LKIGIFGPLFDGAIVHKGVLATLVRATAINASRVLLSKTTGFKDLYPFNFEEKEKIFYLFFFLNLKIIKSIVISIELMQSIIF